MPRISLIIGSAPDAVRAREWGRSAFSEIVAINNAWAVRPDWDYLIHPDDFPEGRLPDSRSLRLASIVTSAEFVPAQNMFGGFVYAGGTMAFTAGYWALKALKPDIIAFLGCDMMYPRNAPTHFYGVGTADPLRNDVTLRDLTAKSARLFAQALRNGTLCLNLSELPQTRLALPRVTLPFIERLTSTRINAIRTKFRSAIDETSMDNALKLEGELGYFVQSGRYWENISRFDEVSLSKIDGHWKSCVRNIPDSAFPSDFCGRGGSKVGAHTVEVERFA